MAKRIQTVGDLKKALAGLDDEYNVMLVDAHGAEADIAAVGFDSDHDGVKIEMDLAFIDPQNFD